VLRAAIDLADREGVEALTMRGLGQELGVEAMSLYHYVASKGDLFDGVLELFLSEVELPAPSPDWKATIRGRAMNARAHIRRHPWMSRLITLRQGREGVSPGMLRYIDWVIGVLHGAGLSNELVHSGVHVLGTRLLGFNEEAFSEGVSPTEAKQMMALFRDGHYPAIARSLKGVHHDDEREFAFGLDVILDGLERARDATSRATA
jgi:AcrR family transcriptional regulator